MFALEFPPISHLVEWPTIFGSGAFAVNKVVLLFFAGAVIVVGFFLFAGSKKEAVPKGAQNLGEMAVEFVQDQIVLPTMGPSGLGYTPFLLALFTFILTLNMIGMLPLVQMPANARMALPALLAVLIWLIYNIVGIKHQGPIGYFKNILFMPGVPWWVYPLLTPIETVSKLLIQPFALAVRLFANMLAGHLLLVSFAVITAALTTSTYVGGIVPGALLAGLTVFELLVAFLQAYIFTILAGVYIGEAMHPAH